MMLVIKNALGMAGRGEGGRGADREWQTNVEAPSF